MRVLLLLGAFILSSVVTYAIIRAKHPLEPLEPEPVIEATKPEPRGRVMGPALNYVAPPERSAEMQAFDKLVMFLAWLQEEDGHWSAQRAGAAPEYASINGDIIATAQASYLMLCTSQGKRQDSDSLTRAKRGVDWLLALQQPDGRIADEKASGDPVAAQMFASMALLQSASMSTRPKLRQSAISAVKYAITGMRAQPGGYGTVPHAEEVRADMTSLATFLFKTALMEEVKFSDPAVPGGGKKVETEIEHNIRAGLKHLNIDPNAELKKGGVYRASSKEKEGNWDATVSGLLSQVMLYASMSDLAGSTKYIFKEPDAAGIFPGLKENLTWGKAGEGYRAVALWQGTLAVVYLYGENAKEWKGWSAAVREITLKHQSPDGAWDVAGPDAQRGVIWRATMHALALILMAPPPPPPPPPEEPVPPVK